MHPKMKIIRIATRILRPMIVLSRLFEDLQVGKNSLETTYFSLVVSPLDVDGALCNKLQHLDESRGPRL